MHKDSFPYYKDLPCKMPTNGEIEEALRWRQIKRSGYLESMACAYYGATDLSPSEVELVEMHMDNGNIKWYFQKKKDIKMETISDEVVD